MRVLLVRHGESQNNRIRANTGSWAGRSPDPDLTALGYLQADKLAAFLAGREIARPDVLLTSLMRRAVATAAPLARAFDLPVHGHPLLHEVGGIYEGVDEGPSATGTALPGSPASVLMELSPHLVLPAEADETGWHRRPFEPPLGAWERACEVVDGLRAEYGDSDKVVGLVTHAWFSQYLLHALLGWSPGESGRLSAWLVINNTGHTYIELEPGAEWPPALVWLNRHDHLDESELTG